MKSAVSSAAANEGKVAVRQYLNSKTGIYTGTYVPVLAHYDGCMVVEEDGGCMVASNRISGDQS